MGVAAASRRRRSPTGEPVWPEPPPKKFGEVISDFDPTAAGYEAQALAVERAAQAAMSGGAVHIGGADSAWETNLSLMWAPRWRRRGAALTPSTRPSESPRVSRENRGSFRNFVCWVAAMASARRHAADAVDAAA